MSDLILYHGTTADFSVVDLKHCKDKKCSKDIHSIDNDKSLYSNKYDYMMVCK